LPLSTILIFDFGIVPFAFDFITFIILACRTCYVRS
jgi:hypothetical protein